MIGAQYARALAGALTGFARAHQLQSALSWAMRLLALGLAIDAAALLARRFWPFESPLALLLLPPMLGLVAGAVLAAARSPRPLWLAHQIDARLGLRERTLTALELVSGVGADAPLAREQLDDAVDHLRRAEPLEAFPLRLPRREAVASLLLLLALVPLLLLARPDRAAQGASAERLALGEAERIQTVAEEIEREDGSQGDAQTNAQVAEMLRRVAEGLRENATDADRAVARLGDAERHLAQLQRAQAFDSAAAMARLADALDRDQRTRAVASAIDRRDYQRAADELRQLGSRAASGSEADRQAISEALRRASAATARYDERLAQQLGQAAERATSGESGATDAAAQELDRTGGELRRQETLDRALSQLQNSRQTIASGSSGQEGADRRAGSRPSPGDRTGSGAADGQSGQGQGSEEGRGQAEGGQGGRQGQGQGEGEGQGGGGAGTGGGAGRAEVYDPAATRLRQVQVPGGDFDRPQVTEGDQSSEGADGDVTVDYRDVLPTYQERATRAMQDRYVPLGMKDLVREYFSSLDNR
ncbi:MAG TPA: hypothetical protein VGM69_22680 [Chloroflexota bacterium]